MSTVAQGLFDFFKIFGYPGRKIIFLFLATRREAASLLSFWVKNKKIKNKRDTPPDPSNTPVSCQYPYFH